MDKLQKAVILHSRKYKESSLLLTLWLPFYGKVSAITYLNKKNFNLYQPFSLLYVYVKKLSLNNDILSRVHIVEFDKNYPIGNYLSHLARLYINEILYWLLPYGHNDERLFNNYLKVIEQLVDDDISHFLRYFELQLLESLGYGFQTNSDEECCPINNNSYYSMSPLSGFRKISYEKGGIKGYYIAQLGSPVSTWDSNTLKVLKKLIRVNLDACLNFRKLKTRKLLSLYLKDLCHE